MSLTVNSNPADFKVEIKPEGLRYTVRVGNFKIASFFIKRKAKLCKFRLEYIIEVAQAQGRLSLMQCEGYNFLERADQMRADLVKKVNEVEKGLVKKK